MDDQNALAIVAAALDAKKAENITLLDLREQSSYLSYFLIATALSRAHLRTLFDEVHKVAVENGIERPRAQFPQYESGWVTYDFGFYVIHLFEAEKRKFYDLEGIWKNARTVALDDSKPKSKAKLELKPKEVTKSKKSSNNLKPRKGKKTTIKKKTNKEITMATKKKAAKKKAAKKPAKKKAAKKK